MSALFAGKKSIKPVDPAVLAARIDALEAALDSGGAQLPPEPALKARTVVRKARERSALVGGHTVVALAGATGSGKSSLFNALVGSDIAIVGARRPTTSSAMSSTWGTEPVGDLLDWLQVGRRHEVTTEDPGNDPQLAGLVLLDLPDLDSREIENHVEAARVLDLVDLFVWVTDPQKYADARLHEDFIAALAAHQGVMVVVLNQVDRLTPAETEACLVDLRHLLEGDGAGKAKLLATSVETGQGLDELRQLLRHTVVGQGAARTRLDADVRLRALALLSAVGRTQPDLPEAARTALVDALVRAAGVPMVVDAVRRDYALEAAAHTGWPLTRWVNKLRARPLKRLRIDDREVEFTDHELRAVLGRSSIPPPTPAAQAAVWVATRGVAGAAGEGLPVPWADALDHAVSPADSSLTDALDQAVLRTPLRDRDPLWWKLGKLLQGLLFAAAVGGAGWYAVLWAMSALRFPAPEVPVLAGWIPVPFVLIVAGLVGGLVLAVLARAVIPGAARRRARRVETRLRQSVADVADAEILGPVWDILDRHAATKDALHRASGS